MKTLHLSIIAIITVCINYSAYAEQEVTITVTPQSAKYGDDLLIYASLPSYEKPDELRYYIDVFDQEGRKVDSTLWFARADFNYTMRTEHPVFNITKTGEYTISVEKAFTFERTGEIVKTSFFELTTAPPPSLQIKRGVSSSNVACNDGLELTFKKNNGTPVCVKPDSIVKLIMWDWAKNVYLSNPCSHVYPTGLDAFEQPLSLTSPKRLVFLMQQNSTAQMCVRYTSTYDNTGLQELLPGMWSGRINFEAAPPSEITVTSNPRFVPMTVGSNTTVVYTVTSHNAKGIYWIGISQICELIPVAVGLDSSQVISSDIPVYFGFHSCPVISLNSLIIGVSNSTVEYKVGQPIGEP